MSDPTALPSFPPPPDEHPLRGRVLDALIDEGHRPVLDEDGDVVVVVDDQKLFVRCADGALPLMRVFGQWRVGESVPADAVARLRAASELTTRLNLVKLGVHAAGETDVLFVAIDVLVTDDMPLRPVLTSCLTALLNSVRLWHEQAGGGTAQGSDEASD